MKTQDELTFDPESFDWNEVYSGLAEDYEPPDLSLLETIATIASGRALDVGCGAGGLVVALAEAGWTVTGVDIVPKAIAAARQVIAQRNVQATLQVGNATTWRPEGTFDLITNSFALPMTRAERAPVYVMMRQALRPGGHVLIKDFDPAMSRFDHFAGIDMVPVDELTEAFAGFELLRAEVVDTPAHHHSDSHTDEHWTATFFHARKPVE